MKSVMAFLLVAAAATDAAPGPAVAGPTEGALWMDFERGIEVVEDRVRQTGGFRAGAQAVGRPQARDGASLGTPAVAFEGGVESQRGARVVDDPVQPGNKVLLLSVQEPNVRVGGREGAKSRVQINLYDNVGVTEVYESVRLRLGDGLEGLAAAPTFRWFTISEWWNRAGWIRSPHAFRIAVDLMNAGGSLGLVVRATVKDPNRDRWTREIWSREATSFKVPLKTWMRIEYYYREGGADDGRFVMAVTPDGGSRVVVADVTGFTHHPDDAQPVGLAHLNPIKLYTSKDVTDAVKARGGSLQLFWDDLLVLPCTRAVPGTTSRCATAFGLR